MPVKTAIPFMKCPADKWQKYQKTNTENSMEEDKPVKEKGFFGKVKDIASEK